MHILKHEKKTIFLFSCKANSSVTEDENSVQESCIGHDVNRQSIENYLHLPMLHVDSTVSCREASQSPVYRLAFRSTPIILSHSCRLRTARKRSTLAKTLTPFGTSLVCPQGGFSNAGVFHRIHLRGHEPSPCSNKFCTRNIPTRL